MRNVAVDILTGFLGSGKTTVLRHVLAHGLRDKRVAIVMNEIGEVGLDGKVITGLSAVEKMIELAGGCICCSIDEYRFDMAIQEIIDTVHPHLIIIESTGLADPEPLAYRVKNAGLGLDAVITLVDAANAERCLK
jgi:G3E family GTPase